MDFVKDVNLLIPLVSAIFAGSAWFHSKLANLKKDNISLLGKIHELELRMSEKYVTKQDIFELRQDLNTNFTRVHERLDALKAVK